MKYAKKKLKRNAITLVIILIILITSVMLETCSNDKIKKEVFTEEKLEEIMDRVAKKEASLTLSRKLV